MTCMTSGQSSVPKTLLSSRILIDIWKSIDRSSYEGTGTHSTTWILYCLKNSAKTFLWYYWFVVSKYQWLGQWGWVRDWNFAWYFHYIHQIHKNTCVLVHQILPCKHDLPWINLFECSVYMSFVQFGTLSWNRKEFNIC